jgi:flagellar hook-length control protein FliK
MSASITPAALDVSAASSFLSAQAGGATTGEAGMFGALIEAGTALEGEAALLAPASVVVAEQSGSPQQLAQPMPALAQLADVKFEAKPEVDVRPELEVPVATPEKETPDAHALSVMADHAAPEPEGTSAPEEVVAIVPPPAAPAPHSTALPVVELAAQAATLGEGADVSTPSDAVEMAEVLAPQIEASVAKSSEQPEQQDRRGRPVALTAEAKTPAPMQNAAMPPSPAQSPEVNALTVDDAAPAPAGSSDGALARSAGNSANPADSGLPSPLLTQAMPAVTSRPTVNPYPQAAQAQPHMVEVQAQPGRFGADMGIEIARAAKGQREDLLIRLDPREMGRIDVRLSFDRDGILRAVMSTESPAALDLLRRESADLNRALADAGVRSDGQSLRFDARSGEGAEQGAQRWRQDRSGGSHGSSDGSGGDLVEPQYRPLRANGQVDLIA